MTTSHPLANFDGIHALGNILHAHGVWLGLSRPQRQLLLSCVAGFPIKARADVQRRMVDRGLIAADLTPTVEGRLVARWRLP